MGKRILRMDMAAVLGLLAIAGLVLALRHFEFPASADASAPDPPATAADDVDSLRAWIDRIHPHPYRVHSSADFDAAADRLRDGIDRLTDHAAALELRTLDVDRIAGDASTMRETGADG